MKYLFGMKPLYPPIYSGEVAQLVRAPSKKTSISEPIPITLNDKTEHALHQLKKNKSSGLDGSVSEQLYDGGSTLKL